MSKKKSYMDSKNIISEGVLDTVFKFLVGAHIIQGFRKAKKEKLSSDELKILQDPKIKAALKDFYKYQEKAKANIEQAYERRGLKPPKWE